MGIAVLVSYEETWDISLNFGHSYNALKAIETLAEGTMKVYACGSGHIILATLALGQSINLHSALSGCLIFYKKNGAVA